MTYSVHDYLEMIEKDKQKMFVPFDNIDSERMGSSKKAFVRCLGKYLKKLYFYKKNNPDAHFVTCVDDFIRTCTEDEFEKLPVSVILKVARKDELDFSISEVIAPKIAELYGINSPYVEFVGDDRMTNMSVDFLSGDQTMETFLEMNNHPYIDDLHDVNNWAIILENTLRDDKRFQKVPNETKSQLIEDLIKALLVRKFVLFDNDANDENLGFIHNPDYSQIKLISFDYEFCFNNSLTILDFKRRKPQEKLPGVIWDLAENYPNELKNVMKDLVLSDKKKDRLKEILADYSDNKDMQIFWYNNILKCTDNIINWCSKKFNQIEKENEFYE